MGNTINVNYMTKTYSNFVKNYEAKSGGQVKTTSFSDKVAEKSMETQNVSETGKGGIVSTKDMTMEEYKQYIHDKISQIPVSPSQMSSSFSVHISDAGFEAMRADPEYEKWVLDTLKYNFGFNNPWTGICGGIYAVHNFGASKEEYSGQSWHKGYQNGKGESLFQQKAEDSFWERRIRRSKELQERFEELQEKRMLDKRMLGEDYVQQTYFSAELLFTPSGDGKTKKP